MAKANAYKIDSARGGISDWDDKGIEGSFDMGANLNIRRRVDSIYPNQALMDIGVTAESASASTSPSASVSPSASGSPSPSASTSPSASLSPSPSPSSSISPSSSKSPSASSSPSASVSPSSSVSPSPSPSAGLLSVFTDLILWFVKSTDGFVYGFGDAGKVYKINPDDFYVQQVYDAGQRITGAWEFPADNGKSYLYFATLSNVHRKELPGLTNWNDVDADDSWPKTNLDPQEWHTMREAGGSLIIANGSNLALIGYDQSYTNEALNLIPGNVAKTIVERNGRTIVGTARLDNPNKSVNAAIDSEVPLAQVGDEGEIFFANMTEGQPVKEFPGGGKVNPGGVTNEIDEVNFFEWEQNALNFIDKQAVGSLSLWGVYGADSGYNGIYSYGRKKKNQPFAMNMEHEMDFDEIGAVVSINGIIMASYKDGSTYGVQATDANNKAVGRYDGLNFASPIKAPIEITNWMYADVFMDPLPAGTSVEFWYKLDKTGDFVQAQTADGQSSYSAEGGKKAVFTIQSNAEIFQPRLVLNPYGNDAPEVYRAYVYFD